MAEGGPPEDRQRGAGQGVSQRRPGGGQVFGDGVPPACGRDPVPQSGTFLFPVYITCPMGEAPLYFLSLHPLAAEL